MSGKIKLADILSLKYLSKYVWSPNSEDLVYLWNDGGVVDAWVVPADGSKAPAKITNAKSGVSAIEMSCNHDLALVIDGNIYIYDSSYEQVKQITTEGGYRSKITWTSDGKILTYSNGMLLMFYNSETKQIKSIKPLGEVFAGKFSQTIGNDSFNWSPNNEMFLYTYTDNKKRPYLAIINNIGEHLWTSATSHLTIGEGSWINDNKFIYRLASKFHVTRSYFIATIPPKHSWNDYSHINAVSQFRLSTNKIFEFNTNNKGGMISNARAINDNELLVGSEHNGFYHYYLYNINTKELQQLTSGECEDFGQMGDQASFSPSNLGFVFASNRKHRIERQLYTYDFSSKTLQQLTDLPVTNTSPVWSPCGNKIAYFHADSKRNGDLWIYDIQSKESYQLTNSMPEGLSQKLVEPELITYKGAENWDIDAFLYKPADFDANKTYPAIVWVHGGPIRQMRGSFHPSGTYSHYYAFNQYLANQGYIILSPNFRGGIGYGRDFRYGLYLKKGVDDTIDIVNAGRHLKELPFVNKNKVAVYGLSYGGYMTLHCLTQYPEEYVAGINLAGLWDIAQWARWIKAEYGNYNGDVYFGGSIEERPDLWALGSPVTYKQNLCKPLMSLQGTGDLNVDFNQLNRLVKDLTKMRADHEAIYYPDEMHSFRWRHTWCDALPRMVAFFDTHLKEQ